jgi:hypothetical protein
MLVGYASNSKAYRVFNNSTRVVEETCDMEFDESIMAPKEMVFVVMM